MRSRDLLFVSATVLVAACADSPVGPSRIPVDRPALQKSEGRGVFQRYVAIGTSVSMGWASDGGYVGSQLNSWPAQLARLANREITQPYIASPGCRSPIVAPLSGGVRLSGESIAQNPATLSCAPLVGGVALPTQNLAVNAALASDALGTTPENTTDQANRMLYTRILPPGATQVSAMVAQNPKFVSVEFGGNEVLNARAGIAIPGVTLVPFANFAAAYTAILDKVESVTTMAVLVGLVNGVQEFPSFRSGNEIWNDRAALLAAFNVAVNAECNGSPNLIFTPVRIPTAVATGLALRQASQPAFDFRCADGGPTAQDYVLTPSEAGVLNLAIGQIDGFIAQQAAARGYAVFRLEALYGAPGVRPPYSSVVQMTSPQPYGPYISNDGVHPNAAGQALLAEAAAEAINATYNLGIPVSAP